MINLILNGGLGNQMFEYATAVAIAAENGLKICVNLSFFDAFASRTWCRPYGMDIFALDATAQFSHRNKRLVKLLPKLNVWCRKHGIQRLGHLYFELDSMTHAQGRQNITMFGYFTNVHVFDAHADAIREAFTIKTQPNAANTSLIEQMQMSNSVAVHIRRGDYLNAANTGFAKIGEDWYRRAMMHIASRVDNPQWFFFSDDMAWVQQTFSDVENAVFVDINHGAESYNDMRLMQNCKHNIIANSTFSWWAAWLNPNPSKYVVAPHDYFANAASNQRKYLARMIPQGWTILN